MLPLKPRIDTQGQAGYAGNKGEGEGIDHDTHTDSSGAEAPAEPTALQTENVQQGESAEAGQNVGAEGDFSHQGVGDATEGAGDYSSLAEKARNVDVSTSAHQAVYYSGKGNRARAEAFAELNGKTTLEMTPGGKYFDSLKLFEDGSPVTKDQAYEIWKILSERYAKSASGNVYGFVKGSFPESIFNTVEYHALQKNPYITNIFTELLN